MKRAKLRQSVGYVSLFSSLGAAAVVTWITWKLAVEPMSYIGDNATNTLVRKNHQWTTILLDNLPIVFVLIAMVGSIAFVVYQTRFA